MLMSTPNMNLRTADRDVTTFNELIDLFNQNMNVIDSHDHFQGRGRVVPTSAILGNGDLDLNRGNLLSSKALECISNINDSLLNTSIYFKGGELFIRDGAGRVLQITKGGKLTTQTNPVTETTSLLYGFGAKESDLDITEALAKTLATASFGIQANRTSKTADSVKTGSYIKFKAPAPTGYYRMWVAILNTDLQANTLFYNANNNDQDEQWVLVSNASSINTAVYSLYARKVPLAQVDDYELLVKSFR